MASDVIGWAVWISKPEYMTDREEFWKRDGETYEDVLVYVQTLEQIYGWYISITEYHTLEDGDFYEVPIEWRKK